MKLKVLDLFSGIGGFSLGLEQTGYYETVAFCEIDKFCQEVLRKHWPDVPIYDDVRSLKGSDFKVDVITGGFPCQDISVAGKGVGIKGERSGLWGEIRRLTSEIRPSYLIVENVSLLKKRGLGVVLRDLCQIGYDAEWFCIPAKAVGAPHERDRIWIVAYPNSEQLDHSEYGCCGPGERTVAPKRLRDTGYQGPREPVSNSNDTGREEQWGSGTAQEKLQAFERCGEWLPEPGVGRVADGIPNRVDRVKALGNSLVPQIPYQIGRAIIWQKQR